MKLRAKDTFHTSGVGVVHAGTEFEVHDALGKEISDKGLAEIIEASTDTDAGADQSAPATPKQAPPLSNKMEPELSNKTKRRREKAEAERAAGSAEPEPDEG